VHWLQLCQAPRVLKDDVFCLSGKPAQLSASHHASSNAFVQHSTMFQPVSSIEPGYISLPQVLSPYLLPDRRSPFFGAQRADTSFLVRPSATHVKHNGDMHAHSHIRLC
jgi:hypothetical protein